MSEGSVVRRLAAALGVPLLLVLVQQQLLLRQRPHVVGLRPAAASAGPAALKARFSRPLPADAVQAASALAPPLAHRWLGSGDSLSLVLNGSDPLPGPLQLRLAGRDRRGLALAPTLWRWDPRARVLAVVPTAGGERLELRDHDGRWRPLGPVWPRLVALEPLGDGSGVAVVSADREGRQRAWRIPLRQHSLSPAGRPALLGLEPPQPLGPGDRTYVHLSADRLGNLLLQSGPAGAGAEQIELRPPRGWPRRLALTSAGPLRLLPEGGAVVVPRSDGLALQPLRGAGGQVLPGRRDLISFCPQSGRALLLRHWPDYRRSLELVEPGLAPRQLWLGQAAVLATACAGGGQRLWLLLLDGLERPRLSLLALDRRGRPLARRALEGWQVAPGATLAYDPASGLLLTSLRRQGQAAGAAAEAVLIDARSLEARGLGRAALQTAWLPPG